jgi:hypothetical protein
MKVYLVTVVTVKLSSLTLQNLGAEPELRRHSMLKEHPTI